MEALRTIELEEADIKRLHYSWEIMAPRLSEISLYLFNELYNSDYKKIPTSKVDIDKFSIKALNVLGFMMSNIDNLPDIKPRLSFMIITLYEYGKLQPFTEIIIQRAFLNSLAKAMGSKWSKQFGLSWLRLNLYIKKEILIEDIKVTQVNAPVWA